MCPISVVNGALSAFKYLHAKRLKLIAIGVVGSQMVQGGVATCCKWGSYRLYDTKDGKILKFCGL